MTLLTLNQLRIDDQTGQVLCAAWQLDAGERALSLVGDFTPLCLLLTGTAQLAAGTVLIAGEPAVAAVQAGRVGVLAPHLPLPRAWTVSKYLQAGAELLGLSRRSARDLARSTLQQLSLPHLDDRRFETLSKVEIRLAQLAQALLGNPGTLFLHELFSDLEAGDEVALDARLLHISSGRNLIISATKLPHTGSARAALERADSAVLLLGGQLFSGSPTELFQRSTGVNITVSRNASAFVALLGDAGITARTATAPTNAGVARVFAEGAGEGLLAQVVNAALSADAPVLELLPTEPEQPEP